MKKFCFVILHYLIYDDTIECINSILGNIDYKNFDVVVVDNGSNNGSGDRIKEKYEDNSKIFVIINPANLGFAKGNNVGYQFAKYKLKSDFIALINNDTLIKQNDFIDSIINKHAVKPFHILGPDIISIIDGRHQNPSPVTLQDKDVLIKFIKNYKILLFLNYFLIDKFMENFKKKIIKKPFINLNIQAIDNKENKELVNVKLHGSCLVFSPEYIQNYEGLYPKTFMYSEEAILYFIAKRDHLTTIYFPQAKIYHKEDSSTEYLYKKNYKKRRFYYKNFIDSGFVFLELMEKNKDL
jgi:GT2 family glycosyltransferase